MNDILLKVIRLALGNGDRLNRVLSPEEWISLYKTAKKQSLVGICFVGIKKLPAEEQPPKKIFRKWLVRAVNIQQANEIIDQQCVQLQEKLTADGFNCCILKGQGVALYYGSQAVLRQPGDIDVWVTGDYQKTIGYLKELGVDGKIKANHAEARFFDDTEVEIHPLPAMFRCPWYNTRFMRFCNIHQNDWEWKSGFNVPSVEFNLVFLMVHMYQHTLREGLGLRQMLDYYWTLYNSSLEGRDKERIMKRISSLGMNNFAAGVMYIMDSYFGLEKDLLLCPVNQNVGQMLMEEILVGGNFGHYDERNKVVLDDNSNPIHRVISGLNRNRRFLRIGFWEIICSPLWRLWHFCWMKRNGYR